MRSLLRLIALFAGAILWAAGAGAQTFQTSWGTFGSGASQFNSARGISVDLDEPTKPTEPGILLVPGSVYVADTNNNRVQKFDHNGVFITQWGVLGSGTGQLNHPEGIAVRRNGASSGIVYVADTGNNRIHAFFQNGANFVVWGTAGSGNGQFNSPQGVATNKSTGRVYVADTNNNRIQYFDSLGTYNGQWGTVGAGNGQFSGPQGVAVDATGLVYVIDTGNNRVQKFDAVGSHLLTFGTFTAPEGIAVAGPNVFVADTGNNRIRVYTLSGVFVTQWGTAGSSNGQFQSPAAVGVNFSNEVFVSDTGNSRIQRFGLTAVVPTLGEWGLILLAVLFVTTGALVFARRRRLPAAVG